MTFDYGVTWKRYYILWLFAVINFCNAFWRITSSRTRGEFADIYNLNTVQQYALKVLFTVIYLPGAIIAVLVHNRYSLRSGVVIGALVQSIGAFTMIFTFIHYSFVYLGDAIISIVHQMIVFGAPLLAVKWFEDSKRVIAISLAVTFAYLGTGESYGLNTYILNSFRDMNYSK